MRTSMMLLYVLWCNCLMLNEALKIFEGSLSTTDYKLFYHRSADFGPPTPEYNVTGKLRLMHNATACSIDEFRRQPDGSSSSMYEQVYANDVVLILRGGCTFSTKVYHAQQLGAVGVVVGNYLQNGTNGEEWVVMSRDDDDSHIVAIPSVFVPHSTYQWLYSLVRSYSGSGDESEVYAMLDADGEYVAPTNTFWIAIFGVVIIIIPTLWCLIVCLALVRKRLVHYVQNSRRRRHLTTIPVILYGKKKMKSVAVDLAETPDESSTKKSSVMGGGGDNASEDMNISSVYAKLDTDPAPKEHCSERKDSTVGVAVASALQNEETTVMSSRSSGKKRSSMSEFLMNSFRAKKAYYAPMNDSCAVCLDDYCYGEQLRLLPCNHAFHTRCIDPWLSQQSELCPMCKQSIFMSANNSANNSDNSNDDEDDERFRCLTKLCCITRRNAQSVAHRHAGDADDIVRDVQAAKLCCITRRNAQSVAHRHAGDADDIVRDVQAGNGNDREHEQAPHSNEDSNIERSRSRRRRRRRPPQVHMNGADDDGNMAMIPEANIESDGDNDNGNGVMVLGRSGELVPIESDSNHSDCADDI
eukprot:CAMPEP_0202726302 /NCGR_PEP_ID=MMETSP1385-20130828/184543_1 /ASSEMBLY_ACC=CAM_ASM_000861 /TAXON_ID=933848 /ORGANISM="Elphidium margaritaceum" /LENGTH=582 /DNA_ID=CAMNT_0049392521 /DNA_START=193 /DNA_END=1941 /DNA_ORIENTATION=+